MFNYPINDLNSIGGNHRILYQCLVSLETMRFGKIQNEYRQTRKNFLMVFVLSLSLENSLAHPPLIVENSFLVNPSFFSSLF